MVDLEAVTPDQLRADAFVLLQYAERLEKSNLLTKLQNAEQEMIDKVHEQVEHFRDHQKKVSGLEKEKLMRDQLASVYKLVRNGEIRDVNATKGAIMAHVSGPWNDSENPRPEMIPNCFLMTSDTIRTERGPVEAAAQSVSDYFQTRGSRQIMEYSSRIKKGLLVPPQELESDGWYHLSKDFNKMILTKVLSIPPDTADEMLRILKLKNIEKLKVEHPNWVFPAR